jgi:hypothetical protein
VNVEPDVPNNSIKYTMRIAPPQTNIVDCPGFFPLFASSPFGTRTHVLSNPLSDVQVNGQDLTVLKDQLCRPGSRFNEQSILNHIHQPAKVPGVVEAVHSETIESPLLNGRQKHRLGLLFSHSGGRRRLPLLHQVSPWRKVCIYMPIWVVPHNDWWIVMT